MAKKVLTGKVVSLKMSDTAVVSVETIKIHPRYKKRYKSHKNFMVHLFDKKVELDQVVNIEEGKPMSKNKCWYLVAAKEELK